MALTYGNAFKTGGLDGSLSSLNAGTGQQSSFNVKQSTTTLASMPFNQTAAFAGSAIVSGNAVAAANALSASGTPTNGTIDNGTFTDKNGAAQVSFTIGLAGSGSDMTVGAVAIPNTATAVTCSGITFTMVFS